MSKRVKRGRKQGKARWIRSMVEVTKQAGTGDESFWACVKIGFYRACEGGSNPRTALAAALERAALVIKHRRGGFAGLSRGHSGRK